MRIVVEGFRGANQALQPRLLPPTVGVTSTNQKPGRGDLRPWKNPLTVYSNAGMTSRGTIYRMGRDVVSDANYWLSWPEFVHAVRGFDATDTTERTYYTGAGDGVPKVTDNTIALATAPFPTAYRIWGVPAPISAPTVATDAGGIGTSNQIVGYVYTYVTDKGEESAPSPASAFNTRKTDATATINGFSAVPSGFSFINRIRIYRTQSTTSGGADFYFLREITIATTSTTDDNRTLGESLPSATWLPPPGTQVGAAMGTMAEPPLTFLTAMWNGMLAGISGNSVRICEAFQPYAWPIAYEILPPDGKPVGIGVIGQQMLVLTTNRPLMVAGSSPDSMDQSPVEMRQGCIAAKSIASLGNGVVWASNDGLCSYGFGRAPGLITAGIMIREDWQALNPASITGKIYEGLYFGSYDNGGGRVGFLIDPANPTGMYFLGTGYPVSHFDELQDQLYVYSGTSVQRWDADSTYMTATFKSKVFYTMQPTNFAWCRVTASAYPVTCKVHADGALKLTQTVTSIDAFRLPGGFRATDWQVEVSGTNAVQMVVLASTTQELDA